MRLAGEHVVVTGAGRGIGEAIAVAAAAEGAFVTCTDIDAERAGRTAAGIVERGGRAASRSCDVRDMAAVESTLADIELEESDVSVLVANAGGAAGDSTPFLELTERQWRTMIDRNLTGAFNCGLMYGRRFAERRRGSIVFVTSFAADIAPAGLIHYSAAKAGVRQLMRGMALELGPLGVRVNAVAPGFVLTDGNRAVMGEAAIADALALRVPLRRIAAPDDIAGAVVHLASSQSSYATGVTLTVDGGWSVRE